MSSVSLQCYTVRARIKEKVTVSFYFSLVAVKPFSASKLSVDCSTHPLQR